MPVSTGMMSWPKYFFLLFLQEFARKLLSCQSENRFSQLNKSVSIDIEASVLLMHLCGCVPTRLAHLSGLFIMFLLVPFLSFSSCSSQVQPQLLAWIEIWALTWPPRNIQLVVSTTVVEPLLYVQGHFGRKEIYQGVVLFQSESADPPDFGHIFLPQSLMLSPLRFMLDRLCLW